MNKMMKKILTLGVVVAASASIASADPMINGTVSINGTNIYNSTAGIVYQGMANVGADTGTLAALGTCMSCVTMTNLNYNTTLPVSVFTVTNNGVTVSMDLNAVTSIQSSGSGATNSFVITGVGTLFETGYAATSGTYVLTSQGGPNTEVTFSATAAATPEPNTLMLLGTGLMSSAGALYRRRRAKA